MISRHILAEFFDGRGRSRGGRFEIVFLHFVEVIEIKMAAVRAENEPADLADEVFWAQEFFQLKKRLDPSNKFRNRLWDAYYEPAAVSDGNPR